MVAYEGDLEPGRTYRADWPLKLPYHHAGRIEWINLDAFPQLSAPGKGPWRITFELVSRDIEKVFRQYRWNDTFRCRILRVELPGAR